MTERQALFEAILANPDDDLPRLVFADWLEERGETDRSEFIRVQIERARLDEYDPRQVRLQEREEGLLEEHEKEWSDPFFEMGRRGALPANGRGWKNHGWEYRRGFVDCVEFWSAEDFLTEAEGLFQLAPVRHLYLHGHRHGWFGFFRSRHLIQLEALEIDQAHVRPDDISNIATTPLIQNLRRLLLNGVGIGDDQVGSLTRSLHLCNLRALGLGSSHGHNFIGPAGAQHLARSPYITNLTFLDLSGNTIGTMGAASLVASPNCQHLTHLALSQCGLGGGTSSPLLASPHLTRLCRLELANNGLSASFGDNLSTWPYLSGLRYLDLQGNALLSSGVAALVGSPAVASLRVLILADNGIGDVGVQAILASPHLGKLHLLDLRGNGMILSSEREALKRRFGNRVLV